MIIKLRARGEDSWRFYDNARDVQAATITMSEAPTVEGVEDLNGVSFNAEGITHEMFFVSSYITQGSQVQTVRVITFFDHTGEPHHLYTDAEAYLLNDAGKTIERLN